MTREKFSRKIFDESLATFALYVNHVLAVCAYGLIVTRTMTNNNSDDSNNKT